MEQTFCGIRVSKIFRLTHIFSRCFFCQTETKTETKATKARKKDLTVSDKSLIFLERETGFEGL